MTALLFADCCGSCSDDGGISCGGRGVQTAAAVAAGVRYGKSGCLANLMLLLGGCCCCGGVGNGADTTVVMG